MIDWASHVEKNFLWSEVVTGDTPSIIQARRLALAEDVTAQMAMRETAGLAQWVRGLVGRPVRVTSGYRGPAETGSQHDTGHALDLQVDGMSPIEVMTLIWKNSDKAPIYIRQCIAESLHEDFVSLKTPMFEKCGTWVHIAIRMGRWNYPAGLTWSTSTAAKKGSKRRYDAWRP